MSLPTAFTSRVRPPRDSGRSARVRLAVPARVRLIAFAMIVLGYFAFPDAHPDFTAFNADDGAAYMSLAYGLVHGLGYTRNMVAGAYIPHTTWPPAMPVLLMPAMALSGEIVNWFLVKATVILIALAGIALAWLYTKRLSGSERAGDLAALLLALNPFYWQFSRIAMTEVPSVVWWLGSLLLIDMIWACRKPHWREALAAGAFIGAGMLLRGNLFVLALAPLGYLLERRGPMLPIRAQLRLWLVFAAGFCLFEFVWILRNSAIDTSDLGFDGINQIRMLFVKDPIVRDSPLIPFPDLIAGAIYRLREFIIYRAPQQLLPGFWSNAWLHWPGAPFLALAASVALLGLALPRTRTGMAILVTLVPFALLLVIYGWGGSARFWIPATLLTLPLLAIQLDRWLAHRPGLQRGAAIAAVLAAYGASLGVYIAAHERQPYGEDIPWAPLVALYERARDLPGPVGGVMTPQLQVYSFMTGQPAPMTAAALGIEPRYTHLISGSCSGCGLPPPHGAVPLMVETPWTLYALPRPMTERELQAASSP